MPEQEQIYPTATRELSEQRHRLAPKADEAFKAFSQSVTTTAPSASDNRNFERKRWRYLILGLVSTLLVANLQYGWALFVLPLHQAHGWVIAQIQVAFTMFIALETWGTPLGGWIADKLGPDRGPRITIGAGGVLVALGWISMSSANSLHLMYIGGAITGLGAGFIYTTSVGVAVKWFTGHRGLAAGLVAAGFGAGAVITIIPMRMMITARGYEATFFWFGLIEGGAVLIAAQFIRGPRPGEVPAVGNAKVEQSSYSYKPSEVLRQPVFWVLYLLDLLMCAGGLTVTANLATIAQSFDVADVMIWGTTALSMGLIFANLMNGAGRPFFGWLGDRIGNIKGMVIAFALGTVSYFLLSVTGKHPLGYVFFAGMIFLSWGNVYGLFPSMCTDMFGSKYATENLAILYTAKGTAGFLVPLGSLLVAATGNWDLVLYLAAGINAVAILLALAVLRPVEKRHETDAERLAGSTLQATG
ncbi:MAG: oxalate/formate MFS antiporter [Terriglobales bacterium]